MGIATQPLPSQSKAHTNSFQFLERVNLSNSMSQDYHHQGIFGFSSGFERSQQEQQHQHQHQQQQQHHIAQQIRRDKLRVQGFEPPPPLVGIGEEEEPDGLNPVYETHGMLSEMFGFQSGSASTATELLESQISQSYRNHHPRGVPPSGVGSTADWFSHRHGMVVGSGGLGNTKNQSMVNDTASATATHMHQHQHQHHQMSNINAESAAAMQLFLMNPQQQKSPSPSPSHPPQNSSTLHMLLPNPSSSSSTLQGFHPAAPGGAFGQFSWLPNNGNDNNPNEIAGVVEGQGLSLSLSSSLQHLEAAKAEELRLGEGAMLFFGQGGGSTTQFKSLGGGALHQNQQLQVGLGSSFGTVNMLRNSKYAKAAQELLEEFCSVGRGQFKKNKFGRNTNNNGNPSGGAAAAGGGGNSSPTSKDLSPLSASDRLEHQRRKVKLLSMLDEASN
ncbi:hypothetical protein RD792_004095 [Penstemon davidsonii]|uniref:POX domain-containing protein n=1 Tax=Penstemon davidsonii TaxID=160366 RepID=A0ABR0DHM9_9LAMI|nr:hypothetical protein RD792_004095 [Penstemon davidsonii]